MKIGKIDILRHIMIVAEIGSNHNGDFRLAKELVRHAARAGADAVKFQTYRAEELIRKDIPALAHVAGQHKFQYERFKSLEFTFEQYEELYELCQELGCIFLATPFDEKSSDMLDRWVPAFKVASGDITHHSLLKHLAQKRKPIILSTGMARIPEIEAALEIIGRDNVVLLHCVSRYPTSDKDANLLSIPYLREEFEVPVGYSDHTLGTQACITAAALGSAIIEKHFTFDKSLAYGDHRLSADRYDLARMVADIRQVVLLKGRYGESPRTDEASRSTMRRGMVAAVRIEEGQILSTEHVKFLRPADGIPSERAPQFLGRKLRVTVEPGTPLREEHFALSEP